MRNDAGARRIRGLLERDGDDAIWALHLQIQCFQVLPGERGLHGVDEQPQLDALKLDNSLKMPPGL